MAAAYQLGDIAPRRVLHVVHTHTTPYGWVERTRHATRCSACLDCSRNFISAISRIVNSNPSRFWKQQQRCNDCQPEYLRQQKNNRQQRYRDNHRITRTATCQHCSNTFTPQRSTARFCSTACRVAHHRTVNK